MVKFQVGLNIFKMSVQRFPTLLGSTVAYWIARKIHIREFQKAEMCGFEGGVWFSEEGLAANLTMDGWLS
jgi:hypothetical protein